MDLVTNLPKSESKSSSLKSRSKTFLIKSKSESSKKDLNPDSTPSPDWSTTSLSYNNNNNRLCAGGPKKNNNVTVVCPLADSYVASAAREARSVAELAATKKEDKYSGLAADYLFQTLGPINESASDFFSLLAKKISHHSGDERDSFYVPARFRASAAIQRRAATRFLKFVFEDCPE